jgi:hypothetical protein
MKHEKPGTRQDSPNKPRAYDRHYERSVGLGVAAHRGRIGAAMGAGLWGMIPMDGRRCWDET